MGSQRDCTWILGLPGFRVVTIEHEDEAVNGRLQIRVERRGIRRYVCKGAAAERAGSGRMGAGSGFSTSLKKG